MLNSKFINRSLFALILGMAADPSVAVVTTVVGGVGDLDGSGDGNDETAVVQSAAACWDARITTARNFTLNITGGSLSGGTLGQGATSSVDAGNTPTAGNVTIDNDGSTNWYVGAVPGDISQFDPVVNSQWQFVNGPAGNDLYSTVLHEIGHAHGWLCGVSCGFTNPNYDGMMVPAPGGFVSAPGCSSPFPSAGQPALAGCVHLTTVQYDVSLRGDGLGGSGSSVVNELSHPGVGGDLMLGFSGGSGARRTPSQDNVEMFRQAYGDTVNLPPTLDPEDITAECSATGGANVSLDAFAADPENNPLTYSWTCEDGSIALDDATSANPEGFFPLGTSGCRVDVNDVAQCVPNAAKLSVTVEDTTPPVVNCPADAVVECSAPGGSPASDAGIAAFLAGASASDVCDDSLTVTNNAPGFFNLGVTPVTFGAVDDSGNTANCGASLTVQDTTPPTIDSVTASPETLWPPNHKLHDIDVAVAVSDICDTGASCEIVSIGSDEPVNGNGDGNTDPDWEILPPLSAKLRAERAGTGDGRVYTITVRCTDGSGNTSEDTVDVTVPHDKK
ncbi:MAG: HYR domain-containing protein [Gammaproteobacteria bacterium]